MRFYPTRCHKCGAKNPGFLTAAEVNERVDAVLGFRFRMAQKRRSLVSWFKNLWKQP